MGLVEMLVLPRSLVDRFVPSLCPEHCPVLLDEDGRVRENAWKKDATKRLDFGAWLLAWDRYALGTVTRMCASPSLCIDVMLAGAAVVGQMSYYAAMTHKATVAEVAYGAVSEGKWSIFGVLFDEVSRYAQRNACDRGIGHASQVYSKEALGRRVWQARGQIRCKWRGWHRLPL